MQKVLLAAQYTTGISALLKQQAQAGTTWVNKVLSKCTAQPVAQPVPNNTDE